MAKRTFSKTQFGFIAIIWVLLVGFILKHAVIDGMTILMLLMSGAIVFIPIYKNLRK